MQIGMITDSLPDTDFDGMLAIAARLEMDMAGVRLRQLVVGAAPEARCDARQRDRAARIPRPSRRPRIGISALNCSGNPLHPGETGRRHDEVTRKTIRLAACSASIAS